MKAMFLIADYSCMQAVQSILEQQNVPCRFMLHGHGAADSEMLDYLGLGDNKKITAISFISDNRVMELYDIFNKKLSLSNAGKGIAFTIPLTERVDRRPPWLSLEVEANSGSFISATPLALR